jgi:hypothetical protein
MICCTAVYGQCRSETGREKKLDERGKGRETRVTTGTGHVPVWT